MILYLDSSAIVKQYVVETGSAEVRQAVTESEINGTSVISHAEVIATFRKTVRAGVLRDEEADEYICGFMSPARPRDPLPHLRT